LLDSLLQELNNDQINARHGNIIWLLVQWARNRAVAAAK